MSRPDLQLLGSPNTFPPLPQRWDGDHYLWDPWQQGVPSSLDIHMAADNDPNRCDACGTEALPHWAFGTRQPSAGEVVEVHRLRRTRRTRREYLITDYERARPTRTLYATRCAWCGHTEVYDLTSDEHWILDDTDYGPEGSRRPTDTPHPAALAAEENL